MEINTRKPDLIQADNIDDAMNIALTSFRASSEEDGLKGQLSRMMLSVYPNFLRALEAQRQALLFSSKVTEFGGEQFARVGDGLENMMVSVEFLLMNMTMATVGITIVCGSEKNGTCENCKKERAELARTLLRNASEGAEAMLLSGAYSIAEIKADVS